MTSPDAPDLNAINERGVAAYASMCDVARCERMGRTPAPYSYRQIEASARDVPTLIAALREAQADATQGWDTYRRCQIELDGLVREVVAAETKLAAIQDVNDRMKSTGLIGVDRIDAILNGKGEPT